MRRIWYASDFGPSPRSKASDDAGLAGEAGGGAADDPGTELGLDEP